ncbi:heat shock 70 kDa protein 12A-like isoform X2 [Dreissena polymorpha]|uniref:heat shock 70 kDa protein 12A-like isoform X2 n=1 Tax=Dreissena polymorpha TaxID=45954 RepID=UPI002264768C|nr:heat shock 70 kDa protein 12A-like isoform X2 [Dreissena polymorpha]
MAATGGTLVVAAIDFGTTYSGWAFSFKNEFEMEPTRIGSKTWTGGKLSSPKAPTCILIRPDGKTLEAFGFEAESRYSELSESEAYKFWYYFRRFKMSLWNKPIHKDMMLTDETGRELSALHVFALSIRFMKDDLSKVIEHRVAGYKEDDITWVLTVPAIWDDSAKHFMRLAAEQAGISADKLMLALEPEAASLYCRHLPVQIDGESSLSTFHAGQKYLVLDAGGGTIDITVHEVCDVDSIKEIHHANGGDWGGTMIDREFLNFLCTITDTAVIGQFRENHMEDYIDLLQDIENKKRALDTKTRRVTIKIPLVLSDLTKDMTGQSINENIQN